MALSLKTESRITVKIINFLAKMDSCKRDTYQIEQRTYVLFMFELDDECHIFKKLVIKENVFGCHFS